MINNREDKLSILQGLPCGETIAQGISDLSRGLVSVESCLAAIASPRLKNAGIIDEVIELGPIDSEHTLYNLLAKDTSRHPYSAYKSRLQELNSFENALDHRLKWQAGLPA